MARATDDHTLIRARYSRPMAGRTNRTLQGDCSLLTKLMATVDAYDADRASEEQGRAAHHNGWAVLLRILATPTPDVAALQIKAATLENALETIGGSGDIETDMLRALFADILALEARA